jgi:hypothetical protein
MQNKTRKLQEERSSSFLKKRTKKLLTILFRAVRTVGFTTIAHQ